VSSRGAKKTSAAPDTAADHARGTGPRRTASRDRGAAAERGEAVSWRAGPIGARIGGPRRRSIQWRLGGLPGVLDRGAIEGAFRFEQPGGSADRDAPSRAFPRRRPSRAKSVGQKLVDTAVEWSSFQPFFQKCAGNRRRRRSLNLDVPQRGVSAGRKARRCGKAVTPTAETPGYGRSPGPSRSLRWKRTQTRVRSPLRGAMVRCCAVARPSRSHRQGSHDRSSMMESAVGIGPGAGTGVIDQA